MKTSFASLNTVFVAVLAVILLAACGGGDNSSLTNQSSQQVQAKHLVRSEKTQTVASDYQGAVQELYIAYFGRPADPTGLSNFEAALLAANAPTDTQGLNAAYGSNSTVTQLINSFGTSKESQTLYANNSTTDCVIAIFKNVLGRTPQQAGLTFWVDAINSGKVTQGDAALTIMSGALANTTPQGLLDAQLIRNRLIVAEYFTSQVSSNVYSGAAAASAGRTMLNDVTATTDTTAYQMIVNADIQAIGSLVYVPGLNARVYAENKQVIRAPQLPEGCNTWKNQCWRDSIANGAVKLVTTPALMTGYSNRPVVFAYFRNTSTAFGVTGLWNFLPLYADDGSPVGGDIFGGSTGEIDWLDGTPDGIIFHDKTSGLCYSYQWDATYKSWDINGTGGGAATVCPF